MARRFDNKLRDVYGDPVPDIRTWFSAVRFSPGSADIRFRNHVSARRRPGPTVPVCRWALSGKTWTCISRHRPVARKIHIPANFQADSVARFRSGWIIVTAAISVRGKA
ncbi:hypothetical protein [Sphingomonas sp. Leaf62]|uniref:hypothetical protein n=1 Tax=Sphingomonas sp. Leaf62 TaxID=1736228 RepID=UPI0012E317D5|nr:hypothetical protein [Sphingomonas sp. Leaf62]